ncbi:MAG: ECF transporter S component [Clostridia bacterium]|nr:ECF transporter S component [Clostridia bacterium]
MAQRKNKKAVLYLVELSLLTAVVLLLQLAGITLRLPFLATPISLVGIPIALGAMLLGPGAGAWLGFVFGAEVVLVLGVMGQDPFTSILFQDHPILTTLLCLTKSTVAGLGAGLIYKYCTKLPNTVRTVLASLSVPVLNTGIFILGSYTMLDTFRTNFLGDGTSMFYFLVIGCAGVNFLFEFAVNGILSPVLQRLITILSKRIGDATQDRNGGAFKEKLLAKVPSLYAWLAIGGLAILVLIVQLVLISKA